MILALLSAMLLSVGSLPLPEQFQLQTGGKVIQREIPVFAGVDWRKSRRGVCYDKDGTGSVSIGQQFYLDCGRCTCDRYGFWCIPKCSVFFQPDLENCVEIVDIADPCCPRKECVKYVDPSREPTTNPWATVSYFNGIATDDQPVSPPMTPPGNAKVEDTTEPITSFESTSDKFRGAFTTDGTKIDPESLTTGTTESESFTTESESFTTQSESFPTGTPKTESESLPTESESFATQSESESFTTESESFTTESESSTTQSESFPTGTPKTESESLPTQSESLATESEPESFTTGTPQIESGSPATGSSQSESSTMQSESESSTKQSESESLPTGTPQKESESFKTESDSEPFTTVSASTDELVTGPESTEGTSREMNTYDSFTTSNSGIEPTERTSPATENRSTDSATTEGPEFRSPESGLPVTPTGGTNTSSVTNAIYTVTTGTPPDKEKGPFDTQKSSSVTQKPSTGTQMPTSPVSGWLPTGSLSTDSLKSVIPDSRESTTETTDSSRDSAEGTPTDPISSPPTGPTDASSSAPREVDLVTI